jgi:hypothetical protein
MLELHSHACRGRPYVRCREGQLGHNRRTLNASASLTSLKQGVMRAIGWRGLWYLQAEDFSSPC